MGVGPSVLPAAANSYFVLERVVLDGKVSLDPGFAVLVTLTGQANLDGAPTLNRGSTAVVPNAFGSINLQGYAQILACRPPVPGQ